MFSDILQHIFDILTPKEKTSSSAAGSINKTPSWVLHIEDDAEFSEALKLRLEAHGVAVVRAFNGMQGYESAQFLDPASAILLDIEMPNGQGDEILRRLKENPQTASIPVIVLTGRNDKWLMRMMLRLGAEKYYLKPIDFEKLLSELRRHIDVLAKPSLEGG